MAAGVHQVARVRKFSLAVLYAEFIALSSTSDANRKGIPPQCGGGAAQLVHTFTRKCSLQIEVGEHASARARSSSSRMPVNCFCVGRRVYSSNTVSAVPERVCLGPSRLRVGGPEKDAGLISLEYPRGWTDPLAHPSSPPPLLPPHPRTFSIFMEHDITLSPGQERNQNLLTIVSIVFH